jgi:hypothetical protein
MDGLSTETTLPDNQRRVNLTNPGKYAWPVQKVVDEGVDTGGEGLAVSGHAVTAEQGHREPLAECRAETRVLALDITPR